METGNSGSLFQEERSESVVVVRLGLDKVKKAEVSLQDLTELEPP